ncbi:MAG: dihydroxy-acid dehydratase [Firmicutes bacterium]|nr:dihydroxy-acid dehydratase [Bacillota bacterium]
MKGRQHRCAVTGGLENSARRALLLGLGLRREDLERPLIGIANSWTDIVPGHSHLDEIAGAVREGICSAGGTPREFHTCAVCDGLAQGHAGMRYSLPSRDHIADTVEIMARAHCFDGLVLLCSCDKIVPGQLMAALRLNLPSILVTGGAMLPGAWQDHRTLTLSSMRELGGAVRAGRLTPEELESIEENAIPGAGSCAMLGTANTISLLGEAMGFSLPGMGATPAVDAAKLRLARSSGERAVALVKSDLRPRRIVTAGALSNAIAADMALGGSTNSVLHLLALAAEAGVALDLDDFARISRQTPHLCDLLPGGKFPLVEFYREGGMPALMSVLEPLLDKTALTVSGKTVGELIAEEKKKGLAAPGRVIRPLNSPLHPTGGLAVLYGSLAPGGAVVKTAAVKETELVMRGPARTFDCMEDAAGALESGDIAEGSVLVVRYEGPAGGPGMREMHALSALLSGMESRCAIVTDGRFSGSSRDLRVGHVCPEAAAGGPIALVREGDPVLIDLPARRLELQVDPGELARRRAAPPQRLTGDGFLERYRDRAGSASDGAVLSRKSERTRHPGKG